MTTTAPEVPTVRLNGITYRCPFARLFRPHTDAEREALAESVRAHGVVARVETYDSPRHGRRCVIDGATRLAVAAALGLWAVPIRRRTDLTDEQAEALAVTLNADRRHLTPEEQAEARRRRNAEIVAAAREEGGDSLRRLGARFGLSREMVRQVLVAAGVNPAAARVKVRGLDGKLHPAAGRARAGGPLAEARKSLAALQGRVDQLLAGAHAGRLRDLLRRHRVDPEAPLAGLAAALADLAAEAHQPAGE